MWSWIVGLPDRLAARVERHRRVIAVSAAVLIVLALAASYHRYEKIITELSRDGTYTRSAILRWRPQLEALNRGEDIYRNYQYPNPPIMALILRPMLALPLFAHATFWFFTKVGLAAVGFLWVLRLAAPLGHRLKFAPAALVVVLAIHPISGDLAHGNVNIFIAFLVFASLELLRRRLDLAAGVLLALAIACKVTPLLFLPYFAWKVILAVWEARREQQSLFPAAWRGGGAILAGVVLGLVIWTILVPGLALGFEFNQRLLGSWYTAMVKPFVVEGKVTSEHANQSIPGVVYRLLTHEPSDLVYDEMGNPEPAEYSNIASIGPVAAKWVIRVVQMLFVLVVVWLGRANLVRERQGVRIVCECAFVALGMLLFSERTWKHHATTTALPYAALVAGWVFGELTRLQRWLVLCGGTASTVLMTGPALFRDKAVQDACLVYGTHTAAFLILLATVGVVLRQCNRLTPLPNPTSAIAT